MIREGSINIQCWLCGAQLMADNRTSVLTGHGWHGMYPFFFSRINACFYRIQFWWSNLEILPGYLRLEGLMVNCSKGWWCAVTPTIINQNNSYITEIFGQQHFFNLRKHNFETAVISRLLFPITSNSGPVKRVQWWAVVCLFVCFEWR